MSGEPRPDAATISITLRCLHCRGKFPSPLFMSPYSTFRTAMLTNNRAQCHHCGRMTGCDKENFLAVFEGGGFIGNETL